MIRKAISTALVVFLLHAFAPAVPAPAVESEQGQSLEQMKKFVKKAIQKNKDVKVVLKDKHKYVGRVTEATDEGFVVSDIKTATPVRLAFVDVKQVGGPGLPTAAKAAIGAGVVAGVLIAIGLLVNRD
jgi:hypothetical protein